MSADVTSTALRVPHKRADRKRLSQLTVAYKNHHALWWRRSLFAQSLGAPPAAKVIVFPPPGRVPRSAISAPPLSEGLKLRC
jgi:hypothetical protein